MPNPKADLVQAIGVTYISDEITSVEQLAEQPGNIDLVAVGASQISFDVMRVLGTNAIFVFAGVPGRKAPIEIDTDLLMRDLELKNQIVFGTVNAGKDAFEAAIRDLGVFMQRWPQALRSLITGRYPIEQVPQLLLGNPGGMPTSVWKYSVFLIFLAFSDKNSEAL